VFMNGLHAGSFTGVIFNGNTFDCAKHEATDVITLHIMHTTCPVHYIFIGKDADPFSFGAVSKIMA